MKRYLKKIRIPSTNASGEISPRKRYRVKIDADWFEGVFSMHSFGWNFEDYGTSGMQINMLDAIYEILSGPPKVKPPKVKPPKTKKA